MSAPSCPPVRSVRILLPLLLGIAAPAVNAGVVINEFMANPSDRQLTWDSVTAQPRLGSGAAFYETA